MEKLLIVAKAAYNGYRNEFMVENPYGYAAGIEKPISFTDFLDTEWKDSEKMKHYLFYNANLETDPDDADAIHNAKLMYDYYLQYRHTYEDWMKKEVQND